MLIYRVLNWLKFDNDGIFYKQICRKIATYMPICQLLSIGALLIPSPEAIGFEHFRSENAQKNPVNPVYLIVY